MLYYIATPYTATTKEEEQERFGTACVAAGILLSEGLPVFSPIVHSHPIARSVGLPTNRDFWLRYNQAWINACTGVIVVRFPGWSDSVGIRREVEYALGKGLPVYVVRCDVREMEVFCQHLRTNRADATYRVWEWPPREEVFYAEQS